jgi:hypothetical protein
MTTLKKLEELVYHGFAEMGKETDRRIKEVSRLLKEARQESKETDRRFQEIAMQSKETDRKFQETAKQFKDTDKQFKETDRQFKETDRQFKETDRKLREFTKHLNGITDSVGMFAESMVRQSASALFLTRGIVLEVINYRPRSRQNGESMEFDVVGSGPKAVMAIEVKLRLRPQEIEKTLEKLEHFFEFFPYYRGLTLYGAVAGMSIDNGVERIADKSGLFVLALSEDNMKIWNDEKFIPRAFGGSNASASAGRP